ncbi:FTR1 family iron permease [Pseudoleptotrichia goodfellowii]|uniref:Iron permease FTR1 family n=1 Tax=Pseudoleptotrichia goodfellowii F0264 TaxID=596323 RepID=D0GP14_9FUSO|nr:FTR1 family protein [Pseudoleptotrichia goodfellowii]EEY34140.1 iron permease FTR1 family [Pseudoleptotrichia goodfellowii F0264]
MGKNYLSKIGIILLICFTFFSANIIAKESYSELYIKITDATTALKNNDKKQTEKLIAEIRESFKSAKNADSPQGKKVQESLAKIGEITENDLREITKALLAFEKEQNPVDEVQVKKDFKAKVYPALDTLEKVIKSKDVEAMKKEYLKYSGVWTRNEAVIRDRDTAYYGKVETAMAFLRSSMEMEPFDYDNAISSFNNLKTVIQEFLDGKKIEQVSTEGITLKQAIELLKEGLEAFKSGDKSAGQSKVRKFIEIWPTVEGDVSTRNASLYTKVETETPVIMVKGGEKQYQEKLQNLITELSQIDTKAEYTFVDAMFILLREGVEALLIVLALVSGLKAANQKKGLKWVYAGAVAGILASIVIAVVLQKLFPAVSSGTNREIIEGFVGIFAVIMMIGIGVWLHSKSSLKAWKDYMDRKMNVVLSTGSFISMFALSFLAVFREGAETILFYAGILPLISVQNLITGISAAVIILIIIALALTYASSKIKVHRVFFILTWMIYFLAFKMLGVSIHMLQVVGVIPLHVIHFIPTVEILGIYANVEVFISQLILILIIAGITLKRKKK